jgi:hypothetical protein
LQTPFIDGRELVGLQTHHYSGTSCGRAFFRPRRRLRQSEDIPD